MDYSNISFKMDIESYLYYIKVKRETAKLQDQLNEDILSIMNPRKSK